MLKTYVTCEGCRVLVHKWYDMRDEGTFCPVCYCVWFPELTDDEDRRIAEEFEENGG
jgi:hypothetical protein